MLCVKLIFSTKLVVIQLYALVQTIMRKSVGLEIWRNFKTFRLLWVILVLISMDSELILVDKVGCRSIPWEMVMILVLSSPIFEDLIYILLDVLNLAY